MTLMMSVFRDMSDVEVDEKSKGTPDNAYSTLHASNFEQFWASARFFIRGYKKSFLCPIIILINEYYMTLYLIMLVNELSFD